MPRGLATVISLGSGSIEALRSLEVVLEPTQRISQSLSVAAGHMGIIAKRVGRLQRSCLNARFAMSFPNGESNEHNPLLWST